MKYTMRLWIKIRKQFLNIIRHDPVWFCNNRIMFFDLTARIR